MTDVVDTKTVNGQCDHNPNKFEIVEMWSYEDIFSRHSHVGQHKRKTKGKEYTSPKIVLPSDFNKYVGEAYLPHFAKIKSTALPGGEAEAIVLLIIPAIFSFMAGASTRTGAMSRAGKRELKQIQQVMEKLDSHETITDSEEKV